MKQLILITTIMVTQLSLAQAEPATVNEVMNQFITQGASRGNAEKGKSLWNTSYAGQAPFTERSCQSCHGKDLTQPGKHVRTGKLIKPLAPSANKNSLNDAKKINKWFKRNCKWTLGRECNTQDKADILSYISQQ
ncbi:MAG: DUF1924 domain-containing protein [Gammaproteobacteria bacterium]|nr:DUF1924 domain-containing protein [Gammaproteobacteria bacterium]